MTKVVTELECYNIQHPSVCQWLLQEVWQDRVYLHSYFVNQLYLHTPSVSTLSAWRDGHGKGCHVQWHMAKPCRLKLPEGGKEEFPRGSQGASYSVYCSWSWGSCGAALSGIESQTPGLFFLSQDSLCFTPVKKNGVNQWFKELEFQGEAVTSPLAAGFGHCWCGLGNPSKNFCCRGAGLRQSLPITWSWTHFLMVHHSLWCWSSTFLVLSTLNFSMLISVP